MIRMAGTKRSGTTATWTRVKRSIHGRSNIGGDARSQSLRPGSGSAAIRASVESGWLHGQGHLRRRTPSARALAGCSSWSRSRVRRRMVEIRIEVEPGWAFHMPVGGTADGLSRRRNGVRERLLHLEGRAAVVRVAQTAVDHVLFGAQAPDEA